MSSCAVHEEGEVGSISAEADVVGQSGILGAGLDSGELGCTLRLYRNVVLDAVVIYKHIDHIRYNDDEQQ